MNIIFVDINNSYTTQGDGSMFDPLSWTQFMSSLNQGVESTTVYFLSGTRNLSQSTELEINALKSDISVSIIPWSSTPWKISSTSQFDIDFGNKIINSTFQTPNYIHIGGGILDVSANNFIVESLDSSTNKTFRLDNVWLNAKIISINGIKEVNFTNNTIISPNKIRLVNYVENFNVDFINSVLSASGVHTDNNIYSNDVEVLLDNVVLTTTLSTFSSTSINGYKNIKTLISAGDVQQSWSSTLNSLDPTISSAINYLSNSLSTITLSGNINYPTSGLDWYNGSRDGVGAFYFEPPCTLLSAVNLSGVVPFTKTFLLSATSANNNLDERIFHFGDFTSATSASLSVTKYYDKSGYYSVYCELTNKNRWKTFSGVEKNDVYVISAFDPVLFADCSIYDYSTSAKINSASTYQTLFLSGTVISGTGTTFDFHYGQNSAYSQTIANNNIYLPFIYSTSSDNYNLQLTVHNSVGQSAFSTSAFKVKSKVGSTYYVDINEDYDDWMDKSTWIYDDFTESFNSNWCSSFKNGLIFSLVQNPQTYFGYVAESISATSASIYDTEISGDFQLDFELVGLDDRNNSPGRFILNFGSSSSVSIEHYYDSSNKILRLRYLHNDTVLDTSFEKFHGGDNILCRLKRNSEFISASYYYEDKWTSFSKIVTNDSAITLTTSAGLGYGYSYFKFQADNGLPYSGKHLGTSADPFNFDQFIDYIRPNGSATSFDEFKCRGYREFLRPSTSSSPWTPIETDPNKFIIIDGWCPSTYGPWFLVSIDDLVKNNTIFSFKNATLKNGVIYNQPYNSGNVDYGGSLYVSNLYDMYIVNQGRNSDIIVYSSATNIIWAGCTIYCEDNLKDVSTSTYYFRIYDSVLTNFTNKNTFFYFKSCKLYLYSNSITESLSNCTSAFTLIEEENNQYNFSRPINYPLLKSKNGYQKSYRWFIENRDVFKPFDGITSHPGYNYPIYSNYELGLYGSLRKYLRGTT